jgi:hypothetical protein
MGRSIPRQYGLRVVSLRADPGGPLFQLHCDASTEACQSTIETISRVCSTVLHSRAAHHLPPTTRNRSCSDV